MLVSAYCCKINNSISVYIPFVAELKVKMRQENCILLLIVSFHLFCSCNEHTHKYVAPTNPLFSKQIIGHGGGDTLSTKNTIQNFENAINVLGYRYLEVDPSLTKDSIFVCCHNETIVNDKIFKTVKHYL